MHVYRLVCRDGLVFSTRMTHGNGSRLSIMLRLTWQAASLQHISRHWSAVIAARLGAMPGPQQRFPVMSRRPGQSVAAAHCASGTEAGGICAARSAGRQRESWVSIRHVRGQGRALRPHLGCAKYEGQARGCHGCVHASVMQGVSQIISLWPSAARTGLGCGIGYLAWSRMCRRQPT
jgi:hypothetical protein